MLGRLAVIAAAVLALGAAPGVARADNVHFGPGAPGIGDPYFPLDGNGGYDVDALRPRRHATTRRPTCSRGVATIEAPARRRTCRASTSTSTGLTVRSITVDGRPATLEPRRRRADGHAAQRACASDSDFTTVVVYDGVPETIDDAELGCSGFIHTDDGALVVGQPHVAATWFPVNDHPLDKAVLHVPHHRAARASRRSPTACSRAVARPRALDDVDVGRARADGVVPDDGDDRRVRPARLPGRRHPVLGRASTPTCSTRAAPRTGDAVRALAGGEHVLQAADAHDQRARRRGAAVVLGQPRHRARLGLLLRRGAHASGSDDWTTLPDVNGHTSAGHRLRPARSGSAAAPVPRRTTRPTTATAPARRRAPTRRLVGGHRRERRLRAVDGRPLAPTRAATSRSRSATPATTSCQRTRRRSSTTSSVSTGPGLDLVRGRRRHARRLDRAGRARRQRAERERLDRRHRRRRAATPRRRSPTARSPGSRRSSTSCRASSGGTRSRPPAASSTTSTGSASRSRTRRGRSTRTASSPTRSSGDSRRRPRARAPVVRRQPGARRAGSTSGSTRASRPTPSGCGASTRASARAQEIFDFSRRRSRPTTRSGR